MAQSRLLTRGFIALSAFMLAGVLPADAAPPCIADIVAPPHRGTTSLTPTIEVEPSTDGNCDPNWKVIQIEITHLGSDNVVYRHEHDRGASRGYSSASPPYGHTVPAGELQAGERYEIKAQLRTPRFLNANVGGTDFTTFTTEEPRRESQGQQGASYVSVEPDTDRSGSDYRDFDLSSADPDRCADACEDDGRCEAYTYVPPGRQGPSARCWLKDSVPGPRSGDGMVSGVKGSPIPQNFNVDRPGSDYRNFDLGAAEPSRCAQACAEDGRCSAYTYVPPGRQGPSARCWLKDSVPRASFAEGLVSGTR